MLRTHTCGELRKEHAGKKVILAGWVKNIRVFGKKAFIDLKDRYGITQLVLDNKFKDLYTKLSKESVIVASGKVTRRKEENNKIETGEIEIDVDTFAISSKAAPLPFELFSPDIESLEETRLKYRYLDLRRPKMLRMLEFRFKAQMIIRNYFSMKNFIEIETPYMGRPTPEGSRDFLIPSRTFPGKFWALLQSPQQYKQLLMVAGVDKYFQMARCYRDEDLRKDRQYEFTQVDIEMSFVDEFDIIKISEGLVSILYSQLLGIKLDKPFPRISWYDAMDKYGSDKPDIRFDLPLIEFTESFENSGLQIFEKIIKEGGIVKAIFVPDFLKRSEIKELEGIVKRRGFPGLAWIKSGETLSGSIASVISDELKKKFAKNKGTYLMLSGKWEKVCIALGDVRLSLGEKFDLRKGTAFMWVTDFPMFEWSEQENKIQAMHHPFTSPIKNRIKEVFTDLSKEELLRIPARAYDLVLNGAEIGGGSIRITDKNLQERIFEILGINKKEVQAKFGMLLNAFKYGVPTHGGIAFGIDRLIQIMLGVDSIRDVIAFPKSKSGRALMEDAPGDADSETLKDLKLSKKIKKGE